MSTFNLIYRLHHLLLAVMLALMVAFMTTAAASASPLRRLCADGNQQCVSESSAKSTGETTAYAPTISSNLMVNANGTLYMCVLEPNGDTK